MSSGRPRWFRGPLCVNLFGLDASALGRYYNFPASVGGQVVTSDETASAAQPRQRARVGEGEPLRNGAGEPLRILMVEDEAMVALDLIEMVSRMGATVLAALATEDEAVEAFARHSPDVVMMDVRLRAGDGVDAVRRLRAKGAAAVVFVTGSTDVGTRRRMEAVGGAPIVSKPVRSSELRAALRTAFAGSAPTAGTG